MTAAVSKAGSGPMGEGIRILSLNGVPMVDAGDDLADILLCAIEQTGLDLEEGDILVLAQKIISKAEGRSVAIATVVPSPKAIEVAGRVGKDPRLVELILRESDYIMRERPGTLIVRHRLGLVLANAGIDQSNIDHRAGEQALLLPQDPDASARALRDALRQRAGRTVGVMIIDSLGRAWRSGTTGTAIGIAGLPGLLDLRGRPDLHGRALQTSELGWADEVAAAASLAMGQADEGRPAVLIRGLVLPPGTGSAAGLVRPAALDLFP